MGCHVQGREGETGGKEEEDDGLPFFCGEDGKWDLGKDRSESSRHRAASGGRKSHTETPTLHSRPRFYYAVDENTAEMDDLGRHLPGH